MKDLGNNLVAVVSLAPVVASGNATTTNSTGAVSYTHLTLPTKA